MNNRIVVLSLCLFMALGTGPLLAGPIPPSPSPVPSAGQSLLNSLIVGPASSINVNWEVIPTDETGFPPGLYAYLYQIQNNTASGVDAYAVTVPGAAFGSIVSAGNLFNDDLYTTTAFHPAFNAVNFPILAGAQGPLPLQPLGAGWAINPGDHTVTWTFQPLHPGNDSDTMYFLSTQPPTYGNAVSQDSIPPSPWATTGPGSQPVPVPAPEPGSLALLGLGAAVLLIGRRVKR